MSFIEIKKDGPNYHLVWKNFAEVKYLLKKKSLLSVVFGKTKCNRVGLLIKLVGNDYDCLWIDDVIYYKDRSDMYGEFLEDMYHIKGVSFTEENKAKDLAEYLEKLYVWQSLKA
jgi:hypothetical protein